MTKGVILLIEASKRKKKLIWAILGGKDKQCILSCGLENFFLHISIAKALAPQQVPTLKQQIMSLVRVFQNDSYVPMSVCE